MKDFVSMLDDMARNTGYEFHPVQRVWAHLAALKCHEIEVKKLNMHVVMKPLPDSDEIRTKARELDEKDFDQWWWETVYKGNVL